MLGHVINNLPPTSIYHVKHQLATMQDRHPCVWGVHKACQHHGAVWPRAAFSKWLSDNLIMIIIIIKIIPPNFRPPSPAHGRTPTTTQNAAVSGGKGPLLNCKQPFAIHLPPPPEGISTNAFVRLLHTRFQITRYVRNRAVAIV